MGNVVVPGILDAQSVRVVRRAQRKMLIILSVSEKLQAILVEEN